MEVYKWMNVVDENGWSPANIEIQVPSIQISRPSVVKCIEWKNRWKEFRAEKDDKNARPNSVESNTNSFGLNKKELDEILKGLCCVKEKFSNSSIILQSLHDLLKSSRTNDHLQGELIDMFGFDSFDLIAKFLENRTVLVEILDLAKTLNKDSEIGDSNENLDKIVKPKNQRKKKYKSKKESDQLNMEDDTFLKPVFTPQRYLPYVFDKLKSNADEIVLHGGAKFYLPSGSKRIDCDKFEEITVPAMKQEIISGIPEIQIEHMDPLAQKGFIGYKKLNIVQSIVYETAYKSKENLLICAPTGAGKTNTAMLAILNVIHEYTYKEKIQKDLFKIIYLAPMKALAAEMVQSFSKRLSVFGINVKELTGDTTLSRKEMAETQMLILTPEKWDVITRKAGDSTLIALIKLLIIDEVHLLHDSRGPVIESIVARTLRHVELNQQSIRLVGLSATLPNYEDVAEFLRVNPEKGLFFFDGRFRPVPLTQTFIGIKAEKNRDNRPKQITKMEVLNEVCFNKVHGFCCKKHQVLVFVHSRNATFDLVEYFCRISSMNGCSQDFIPEVTHSSGYVSAKKLANSFRNKDLYGFFERGFGIHHAGLSRHDRNITEKMFANGHIMVVFCTATLAWGVNLPAHAVVIRGTQFFDAARGGFFDIGDLDVQQIFGRAGRPQFEAEGHGLLITGIKSLDKYLSMISRRTPIESNFLDKICDNLNAEIVSGTVSSVKEGVEWLCYTYFYTRVKKNPLAYGIDTKDLLKDAGLSDHLSKIIAGAAVKLDANQMIRYDEVNEYMSPTDLGRIASNYYICYETIALLISGDSMDDQEQKGKLKLETFITDVSILNLISHASEFKHLQLRDDEKPEIESLAKRCPVKLKMFEEMSAQAKVNCLIQAYISRFTLRCFSLVVEMNYIEQNAGRLCRAMFEIALRRGWAQAANACLVMAKCIDNRIWSFQTPLRQAIDFLKIEWIEKIERKGLLFYQLSDLSPRELGSMLSCAGQKVYDALRMLPIVQLNATIRPITSSIIQISATLLPDFVWNDRFLGRTSQSFWITIENINENLILHYEQLVIKKKSVIKREEQRLIFTIPVRDDQLSDNYQIRVASDYFVIDDTVLPLSMHNCVLPSTLMIPTDLLDLDPLPLSALDNKFYESLYNFTYFNPIQTQVFHVLYQTNKNVLIGAPTGSGKTMCAELAIFKLLNEKRNRKCTYIAPLKALVRERVNDWRQKFEENLGIRVVELTGDSTPDIRTLQAADLLITTPEKWDGITREWETREYVKKVALLIIDEVHLLGVERGSVLEAIVTRIKIMKEKHKCKKKSNVDDMRIVALSTALANAGDIAEWLEVKEYGVFNFRPNVRPVPVQVHIAGFAGQQYCPRMALMNKPAFKAIKTYSPMKPVLIFVASRRQTRLTALALISHLVADGDSRQWLHMDLEEVDEIVATLKDENLKLTLPFGIGMHHAGLQQFERNIVENLFVERKIQILVATATLAWGVNVPAHLVIIKGTEYFDGKTHRYIDFPVTDVLQMIGRAGRPQYDDSAVAVIFVQNTKKMFYKRFLYESFPVESNLLPMLANHVNAEINAETVKTRKEIMFYISHTYFYRRLFANPSYYGIEDDTPESLIGYLINIVDRCIEELLFSECIYHDVNDNEEEIFMTSSLGRIASLYYLHHKTVHFFKTSISSHSTIEQLLAILADNPEYQEVPVRHNEEEINMQLQKSLPIKLDPAKMDSPHTKTHLLLQAHLCRTKILTDYFTDQRSILEQCIRILQAMLDISLISNWLSCSINIVILQQMMVQARWHSDHPLLVLPHLSERFLDCNLFDKTIPLLQKYFGMEKNGNIKLIMNNGRKIIMKESLLDERQADDLLNALCKWPIIQPINCSISGGKITYPVQLIQDERKPNYIELIAGGIYEISLDLQHIGVCKAISVHCPKFPKQKVSGFIVILGEKDTGSVFVSKKIPPFSMGRRICLDFRIPERTGRFVMTLYILSDSYLGIDQEYNIYCESI